LLNTTYQKLKSCGDKKAVGRNHKYSIINQPPKKKRTKCNEAMIRCKYSHKKKISNIGPLYSVAYPATTSASVSA